MDVKTKENLSLMFSISGILLPLLVFAFELILSRQPLFSLLASIASPGLFIAAIILAGQVIEKPKMKAAKSKIALWLSTVILAIGMVAVPIVTSFIWVAGYMR